MDNKMELFSIVHQSTRGMPHQNPQWDLRLVSLCTCPQDSPASLFPPGHKLPFWMKLLHCSLTDPCTEQLASFSVSSIFPLDSAGVLALLCGSLHPASFSFGKQYFPHSNSCPSLGYRHVVFVQTYYLKLSRIFSGQEIISVLTTLLLY